MRKWPLPLLRSKPRCWPAVTPSACGVAARTTDANIAALPPIYCTNPLVGYCYAIVWSVFGPTVPDTLDTQLFGVVKIEGFNVGFE